MLKIKLELLITILAYFLCSPHIGTLYGRPYDVAYFFLNSHKTDNILLTNERTGKESTCKCRLTLKLRHLKYFS